MLGLVALVVSAGQVPIPDHLPVPEASRVAATDGTLIGTLHGSENRTIVGLQDISPFLRQAAVSAEDRNFYHEGGFSPRGTMRALFTDVRSGGAAQGGSTITQQYVRNAFTEVGRGRNIIRKVKEVVLAVKLDRRFSKDKILEFYLNTVYFGRGAYGAEAASRAYFGKPAKDLTLGEASYLAGIIRSPESYQPDQNPAGVIRIRNVVLADMQRDGVISPADAAAAQAQQLDFSHGTTAATTARAAYFIEYVRRFLKDQVKLTDQEILTAGLQISTTLDLKMQDAAEKAISTTLDRPDDPEAALVAMDTDGNVRAMVGGRDLTNLTRAQGFNFAYQKSGSTGGRQAGSAFKPFTLAALVQDGYSIDSQLQGPAQIEIPSPQCRDPNGATWKVSNFAHEAFGSLNMTEATAHSVNTVYAQLVDLLGPKKVTQMAQQAGGWDNLQPVCSITLGTSSVTPLEMARAYSTFAGRGERPDPLAVTKVVASDGRVLFERTTHKERVLDPNLADTVNKVLTQVLDHGTAAGKGIGRPAAGKTGTTENQVDAWFDGYTPNLTAAVWMGFVPDPATGRTPAMTNVRGGPVTGGTLPATIWQKFMQQAVAGTPSASFVSPTITGRLLGAPAPCDPTSPSPSPSGSGSGSSCVTATASASAFPTPTFPALTTPAPAPTRDLVPPPTSAPQPLPTPTPVRTPTPSPTAAPSPSPTPSPTPTPTPTKTPSPTPTPTPTPSSSTTP